MSLYFSVGLYPSAATCSPTSRSTSSSIPSISLTPPGWSSTASRISVVPDAVPSVGRCSSAASVISSTGSVASSTAWRSARSGRCASKLSTAVSSSPDPVDHDAESGPTVVDACALDRAVDRGHVRLLCGPAECLNDPVDCRALSRMASASAVTPSTAPLLPSSRRRSSRLSPHRRGEFSGVRAGVRSPLGGGCDPLDSGAGAARLVADLSHRLVLLGDLFADLVHLSSESPPTVPVAPRVRPEARSRRPRRLRPPARRPHGFVDVDTTLSSIPSPSADRRVLRRHAWDVGEHSRIEISSRCPSCVGRDSAGDDGPYKSHFDISKRAPDAGRDQRESLLSRRRSVWS